MSKTRKSDPSTATNSSAEPSADDNYKVGPGRPPKEHQFKPGRSGNPKGAKRKERSVAPDIKALLEAALSKKVTVKRGDREQVITMAAAGIQQLVAQYAKGDRYARRDVLLFAEKLGVNLIPVASASDAPLTAHHEAILQTYIDRQYDKVRKPTPVIAPAELLDDDVEAGTGT